MTRFLFLLCIAWAANAQTADEIMAKLAANQSRAEAARAGYVYHQDLLVRMKRTNGQLAREENREYIVTPGPADTQRDLLSFSGKYGAHGKEVPISKPGETYKGIDIDAGVVQGLADDFGSGKGSRDGISDDMFPLTERKLKRYAFTLAGEETYRGRAVFRITFQPLGTRSQDDDGSCWEGEALIDVKEFQPVLIVTRLSLKIPTAVKIMFGTNVQQMGFKVEYKKFDGDLWFPVTYGGELKVRALFLYARTISMGLINSNFRKADVQSSVTFDKTPEH